jgi:hypothetical protein
MWNNKAARVRLIGWGVIAEHPPGRRAAQSQASLQYVVSCNTLRGFFYNLQSTPDLSQAFTNDPAGLTQALDSFIARTNSVAGPADFFRVISALGP